MSNFTAIATANKSPHRLPNDETDFDAHCERTRFAWPVAIDASTSRIVDNGICVYSLGLAASLCNCWQAQFEWYHIPNHGRREELDEYIQIKHRIYRRCRDKDQVSHSFCGDRKHWPNIPVIERWKFMVADRKHPHCIAECYNRIQWCCDCCWTIFNISRIFGSKLFNMDICVPFELWQYVFEWCRDQRWR